MPYLFTSPNLEGITKPAIVFAVKAAVNRVMICPSCHLESSEAMNFCGNCGARLSEQSDAVPTTPAPSTSDRRPLSIMFCDLVGSTAMSERLDPEELQDVLNRYQDVCSEVVARYDGYIAQYLGDGILVYFGYPRAHEDDARRVVRAGLDIVDAMKRLNEFFAQDRGLLQVRIGIHTGLVVTGAIEHGSERLALGQAPNIAARIQSMTEPDTVAISSSTHQLVNDHFDCETLGATALKGVSQPVEVYRVIGEVTARRRIDSLSATVHEGLEGRKRELGVILDCWQRSKRKQRQTVLVRGEAGIGKSRLIASFYDLANEEATQWIIVRCSAFLNNTVFSSTIDLIEQCCGIVAADPEVDKIEKLRKQLDELGMGLHHCLPTLAELLRLPQMEEFPLQPVTPERRKQLTIEIASTLLERLSSRQRLVLFIEDIHWADPSTLNLLSQVTHDRSPAQILLLMTCRPDTDLDWERSPFFHLIELNRLSDQQVEDMVSALAAPKILPESVMRIIVERTDGIPLFVEEFTKMLLESEQLVASGDKLGIRGSIDDLQLPTTLHSSLIARLDQLGDLKYTARLASVLGREFSHEMLQGLSPLTDAQLRHELDELLDAQIIRKVQTRGASLFEFRHSLIRDAAYDTILRKNRRPLHVKVAELLLTRFPQLREVHPELLAHHYTHAGRTEQAIEYWQAAGQRSVERFANAEAIAHLTKGISLIREIEQTQTMAERELTMQMALGLALSIHMGWQAKESAHAFERAHELCQQLPDAPELFWILWQLGAVYQTRDIRKTKEITQQLLRLAQSDNDVLLSIEANFGMGAVSLLTGELAAALSLFQKVDGYFGDEVSPTQMSPTGQNPAVNNLLYLALTEFLSGLPAKAQVHAREGVELAFEHAGPPHQGGALVWQGFQHVLAGDSAQALVVAERALPIGTDYFIGNQWTNALYGWALAHEQRSDEAILRLRDAVNVYRQSGIKSLESWLLTLEADGLLACSKYQSAYDVAQVALAVAEESGEIFSVPMAYRVAGDALLALGNREDAGVSLNEAIRRAKTLGALGLLPAIALSLSKWFEAQGNPEMGPLILAEACRPFSEEEDFPHLQRARKKLSNIN